MKRIVQICLLFIATFLQLNCHSLKSVFTDNWRESFGIKAGTGMFYGKFNRPIRSFGTNVKLLFYLIPESLYITRNKDFFSELGQRLSAALKDSSSGPIDTFSLERKIYWDIRRERAKILTQNPSAALVDRDSVLLFKNVLPGKYALVLWAVYTDDFPEIEWLSKNQGIHAGSGDIGLAFSKNIDCRAVSVEIMKDTISCFPYTEEIPGEPLSTIEGIPEKWVHRKVPETCSIGLHFIKLTRENYTSLLNQL